MTQLIRCPTLALFPLACDGGVCRSCLPSQLTRGQGLHTSLRSKGSSSKLLLCQQMWITSEGGGVWLTSGGGGVWLTSKEVFSFHPMYIHRFELAMSLKDLKSGYELAKKSEVSFIDCWMLSHDLPLPLE